MVLAKYRGSRLDQINLTTHRRPAWRVEIFNPRQTSIQDVVRGLWKGVSLDVSNWCSAISVQQNQVFENSTDSVSSRASVTFEIDDTSGVLVGDYRIKIDQRLFADGTPIRIYEGDRRVNRQEWIPVFTGIIRGNPSAQTAARGRRRLQLSCFGRAQMFQRQQIVGINWDYGTDLGTMAVDVAMIEMGLEREEIRFGEFGYTTKHKANALTQIGKMQGLHEIMRVVERSPYFDAEGLLVSHDLSLFKPPVFSISAKMIRSISRVQQLSQFVNSTEVIGLDHRLTKVVNSVSPLAEVNATVGYFDNVFKERIFYSKDQTRRAQNTYIDVQTNSGFLGEDASWQEIDEFSGRLTISTGFAPQILGLLTLAWIIIYYNIVGLQASITASQVLLSATYNPFVAAAIAVESALLASLQFSFALVQLTIQTLMTLLGRYRVIVYGEPFEHVHQEIRAIAALKGVTTADTYERKEVMHWITDIDTAKARARNMLRREQVKSQEYQITLPSIPALEVDDIIEIDTGGQFGFDRPARFYVISIQRNYARGPEDAMMTIRCWHCVDSAAT
jgi:hypothetical protein